MPNTPPFDRLTPAQRAAVISIVCGDAPSRTASFAGVSALTMRHWRKNPIFQEALAEARRDFFSACRSHLNSSLAVAFRSVMGSANHSWVDSDHLKAALFLLERVENGGRGQARMPVPCGRLEAERQLVPGTFGMRSAIPQSSSTPPGGRH